MKLGASIRRHTAAVRAMIVFTVILGVVYPLLVTGIGQLAFQAKADGSLIKDASGKVVGSSLLCQQYVDKNGDALAQYFQARPSNASGGPTDPGCNYTLSGGGNRGTSDPVLKQTIRGRIDAYAKAYDVDAAEVPEDAVTASGSGEDPGISVENADYQAPAVARARNVDLGVVRQAIKDNTHGRSLGFLGEAYVNVVTLNSALDKAYPVPVSSGDRA